MSGGFSIWERDVHTPPNAMHSKQPLAQPEISDTSNAKQICGTIDFRWETRISCQTVYHSLPIVAVHSVYHAYALSREQQTRKNGTPDTVTEFANSRNYGDHSSEFYTRQLIRATERPTNVEYRWDAVEMIRSTHAIFPLPTTQIRSTRHRRTCKRGDLHTKDHAACRISFNHSLSG